MFDLTRKLARPDRPEPSRRGWAEETRDRLAAAARRRMIGHAGVRATGFVTLQHYRTRNRSQRVGQIRPANDNPRPAFRLRAVTVMTSLAAAAIFGLVFYFVR